MRKGSNPNPPKDRPPAPKAPPSPKNLLAVRYHSDCMRSYMNNQSEPDLNRVAGSPGVCCFCGKP